MQIKAMKTFRHGNTMIRRGSSAEIVDTHARDLITRGLAESAEPKQPAPKPAAAPKVEPDQKAKR